MNEYDQIRELYADRIAKKKFKIWYDKRINDIRARVELIQENGTDIDIKPIGIEAINRVLSGFEAIKGMSLRELVDKKQVTLDDIAQLGYEFDYDIGLLKEKKFTMSDRIKLAEMNNKHSSTEKVDKAPKVKETEKEEVEETKVEEDGSVDVVVKEENDKKEDSKEKAKKSKLTVKNLKIAGVVSLVALAGVAIISGGLRNAVKNNSNVPSDENIPVEVSVDGNESYGMTYNEPSNETIYVSYDDNGSTIVDYGDTYNYQNNYAYGSIVDTESMEGQIQAINDSCFSYQPVSFENLVVDSDKDAMYTINNMRNRVLANNCSAETYLNNIVNYLFENGNIFDGRVIKTYDSLNQYAQYIVLASAQSILQEYPNYNHITNQGEYDYNKLTTSFNYMIDDTYRTLTNQGSYRR